MWRNSKAIKNQTIQVSMFFNKKFKIKPLKPWKRAQIDFYLGLIVPKTHKMLFRTSSIKTTSWIRSCKRYSNVLRKIF